MLLTLPLTLVSNSPRRRELLKQCNLTFEAIAPHIDETLNLSQDQNDCQTIGLSLQDLAKRKAMSVKKDGLILACDTVVVLDGRILNKPKDETEARHMLTQLSGREHQVITGICLISPDNIILDYVQTQVIFKPQDSYIIEEYIKTGSSLDKAGAYGIQDFGALFVKEIHGDYYNVVGLPISKIYDLLLPWLVR